MKNFCLSIILGLYCSSSLMADMPSTHGMLLFGQKVTYASHLPMFHKPHDYQAIFQLELKDRDLDHETLAKYKEAKLDGKLLFTLVPEAMDLSKVIDGTKAYFNAHVYSGHFERGGQNIGPVEVYVTKIIYGKKLKVDGGASSDFLAFGQEGEYFGAHIIKGQPTYDAIFSISKPYRLEILPCGRGSCPGHIKLPVYDIELPLVASGKSTLSSEAPSESDYLGFLSSINSQVKTIIYVEYDELNHY